jgi:ABC-type Fe3+/spermidine/putrescine transport system ATPase subunit
MRGLSLVDVYKSYGVTQAVSAVTFDVIEHEIVALLGPSGCGKSTLLALIAGLESVDRGDILWNGKSLTSVPTHQRNFGLMFQDFALFPHMNVEKNVAFGLRMAGLPEEEIHQRVNETLELVGLHDFGKRDVNTLSGGEQQRVALARSLAPAPQLLMLDEPLGSLDRNLRERLVLDLNRILQQTHQTAIYVTHDQEEAFALADRVVVLNAGRIEQVDTPEKIYRKPVSAFVARFLGLGNLLPGEIQEFNGKIAVDTPIGRFPSSETHQGKVTVLLRPDAVSLTQDSPYQVEGTLKYCSFRGKTCLAVADVGGQELEFVFLASEILPDVGGKLQIGFDPERALQIFQNA